MAPPKVIDQNVAVAKFPTFKTGAKMTTRTSGRTSSAANMLKKMNLKDLAKRKADQLSPPKGKTTKRSAFVDITNATNGAPATINPLQKKTSLTSVAPKKATAKISTTAEPKLPTFTKVNKQVALKTVSGNEENVDPQSKPVKPMVTTLKRRDAEFKPKVVDVLPSRNVETRSKTRHVVQLKKEVEVKKTVVAEIKKEIVVEVKKILTVSVEKTEKADVSRKSSDEDSSLYATALDTLSVSRDESLLIITPIKKGKTKVKTPGPPLGVVDFDKENWDDPCQVSHYAMDVFNYLKGRESCFTVTDYMPKQTVINHWMRSLLVDWMVDVQEHFELNHETLYLAVKVMDLYLSKKVVPKEELQLVGAGSLFIASKYDERIPPAIDEFLHVCENIYTREELIHMEIKLFKQMDFCLGMPLSYRFLRRYARCCKTSMPILTLARYILELSLMEYSMVFESESKLAAAALYLALRMKDVSKWTPTLEYYSGYKLLDFLKVAVQLNAMLHKKPKEQLRTVRNKYSHTIFFEVAKTALIDSSTL